MKKILFSLCLLLTSYSANAQKLESGDLSIVKSENQINLVCDFSQCIIDKLPAEVKMKEEGDNWSKGVKEIIDRFTDGCAKKNHNNKIGNFPEAKYTLVYHIINIDDDEDTKGFMELIDTRTKDIKAKIIKCDGSAGHFGSFFNLTGDAFENLGKKIGKLINEL